MQPQPPVHGLQIPQIDRKKHMSSMFSFFSLAGYGIRSNVLNWKGALLGDLLAGGSLWGRSQLGPNDLIFFRSLFLV